MRLQTLAQWRSLSSPEQLAGFESVLMPLCQHAMRQSNIKKRYEGSYHIALKHQSVLKAAVMTGKEKHSEPWYYHKTDLGQDLLESLANGQGWIPCKDIEAADQETVLLLLERGILFEQDEHYCLPAELLIEARYKKAPNNWISYIASTPISLLKQIIPAETLADISQFSPLRNEMAAWLLIQGLETRQNLQVQDLDSADWKLLLTLHHHDVTDVAEAFTMFPDLQLREKQSSYHEHRETPSFRGSLELHMPAQLVKLYRMGVIYVATHPTDKHQATVALADEAYAILEPHFAQEKTRLSQHLRQNWLAEDCVLEQPSVWHFEQLMWRLWVYLHFNPLSLTAQGNLRKADLKKLEKLLGEKDESRIILCFNGLSHAGFVSLDSKLIQPQAVDWGKWLKKQRKVMLSLAKQWETWSKQDEKQALGLLAELPTACWLQLDMVITWLETQAEGKVAAAAWMKLFGYEQATFLHHLNAEKRCIYLLPQFKDAVKNKATHFTAPGWLGAKSTAPTQGFISAAAEIQLAPDCSHKVLQKLAEFCTLSQVEHMITLQLDSQALKRLGRDKKSVQQVRKVLESLQSSLPQAVSYMLDKQQNQKTIAEAAPASLVMVLEDVSALLNLQNLGFELSQPFAKQPEIVLLDASADVHVFLETCALQGVAIETLVQPKAWVTGTPSIQAWMGQKGHCEGEWLELCYQKTRVSKAKQVMARIDYMVPGCMMVQCTKKQKKGYSLLNTITTFEAKHILRVRKLAKDEVKQLALDSLT